jgi:hypothetical protein
MPFTFQIRPAVAETGFEMSCRGIMEDHVHHRTLMDAIVEAVQLRRATGGEIQILDSAGAEWGSEPMIYQKTEPISREEAQNIIREASPEAIPVTLVRLAYYDPDWIAVQNICIELSTHEDKWVRRTCAICFGHLARIHGKIEREKVDPVLNRLLADPETRGGAEDAIKDLKMFLKDS